MNREQLREAFLSLPAEDRADLLDELAISLEREPEIERAWQQEIDRRMDDIESGAVRGIPADEVFAEARRRLRQNG